MHQIIHDGRFWPIAKNNFENCCLHKISNRFQMICIQQLFFRILFHFHATCKQTTQTVNVNIYNRKIRSLSNFWEWNLLNSWKSKMKFWMDFYIYFSFFPILLERTLFRLHLTFQRMLQLSGIVSFPSKNRSRSSLLAASVRGMFFLLIFFAFILEK